MNNNIKFRAWDDVENKMYSAIDIFNAKNGIWYEDNEDGSLNINLVVDSFGSRRKLKMMQFTGLYDKSGMEIYEGDIVKIDNILYQVIFENGIFAFRGIGDNIESYLMAYPYNEDAEIIGNIHQNKELLK